MTCLRYEELKKQLKKMILDARMMKESCGTSKAQEYWETKEHLLKMAYKEIETAQYLTKPEE